MNIYFQWAGFSIPVHWGYLFIVIASWAMNKIGPKWTCLAYVVPGIYLIEQLLFISGIWVEGVKYRYMELVVLIGCLHFIEGILTFCCGSYRQQAIITYRGEKIAGGYRSCGKWIIPLVFFTFKGIYFPILAGVIYNNETFTHSVGDKAQKMGLAITSYGIGVIILAQVYQSEIMSLPILLGLVLLGHELLFAYDDFLERGKVLFTYPEKGIRLMGFAKLMNIPEPFDGGDIILDINHKSINSEEEYIEGIKDKRVLLLHILKITGEEKYMLISKKQLEELQPIFLPPQ